MRFTCVYPVQSHAHAHNGELFRYVAPPQHTIVEEICSIQIQMILFIFGWYYYLQKWYAFWLGIGQMFTFLSPLNGRVFVCSVVQFHVIYIVLVVYAICSSNQTTIYDGGSDAWNGLRDNSFPFSSFLYRRSKRVSHIEWSRRTYVEKHETYTYTAAV